MGYPGGELTDCGQLLGLRQDGFQAALLGHILLEEDRADALALLVKDRERVDLPIEELVACRAAAVAPPNGLPAAEHLLDPAGRAGFVPVEQGRKARLADQIGRISAERLYPAAVGSVQAVFRIDDIQAGGQMVEDGAHEDA